MSAGRICSRVVVFGAPTETVREAAKRMLDNKVGTLVIVDERRRPVGILTDRDIVTRCVAAGRPSSETELDEIMSKPPRSVSESTPIEDALRTMRNVEARRLVVTDDAGALAGILALDDIIELIAEEASMIGELLRREAPRLGTPGKLAQRTEPPRRTLKPRLHLPPPPR